jgi:cation diffusion facilitator CzcD-associated flavoprotein CzcO
VLPRGNFATAELSKAILARLPAAQRAALVERIARAHLHRQVRDPWLRRQLTPSTRADGRRLIVSSDFYPALQRENCKLISWPIATLSPVGIRTSDGVEHEFDCIVFATDDDAS